MADAALTAIRAIKRIRTAQCEAARAEALAAHAGLARMHAAEGRSLAARDAAESGWRQQLSARSPDPVRLRLAGAWLVEYERGLRSAQLDTGIAREEFNAATHEQDRSRARLEATCAIDARLHRALFRKQEALELAEAADAFLRRRRI